MEIVSGRDASKSLFSIEGTQLIYHNFGERGGYFDLSVSLKPELQDRERGFGGSSYEAKKYPAEVRIRFEELHQIMETLTRELGVCYQVLATHKLLDKVREANQKKPQET
jgi:hypothetical protein